MLFPNRGVGGSSPRVRGTRSRRPRRSREIRFIPACAGNSPSGLPVAVRRLGSSPRVRGTRANRLRGLRRVGGSSPRVRGTRPRRRGRHATCRFIPACAGNSPSSAPSRAGWPVHPRVCGELEISVTLAGDTHGSSPRVRGTHRDRHRRRHRRRFIPACAGNSKAGGKAASTRPVHPRVCGELSGAGQWNAALAGSSPRVRGTRRRGRVGRPRGRFIPACAGNSPVAAVRPTLNSGSSPRVRGTQRLDVRSARRARFIPACAGNSAQRDPRGPARPVHPRVCGELQQRRRGLGGRPGSSPRVRGTRELYTRRS